jgi:hypothetical protein
VRPLDPPRMPLPVTPDEVRASLPRAIEAERRGTRAPLYHLVRERFDWLGEQGDDRLRPIVEALAREGRVVLVRAGAYLTLDRAVR